MKRTVFSVTALAAAGLCVIGCRKTEVVGAPPEHVITPQPQVVEHRTVIEHDQPTIIERDRPTVIERERVVDRGNTFVERMPDGTIIERRPDGTIIERRPDGTTIERPR